jgi:hypothetical protein
MSKHVFQFNLFWTIELCVRGGPNQPLHRDLQWSIVLNYRTMFARFSGPRSVFSCRIFQNSYTSLQNSVRKLTPHYTSARSVIMHLSRCTTQENSTKCFQKCFIHRCSSNNVVELMCKINTRLQLGRPLYSSIYSSPSGSRIRHHIRINTTFPFGPKANIIAHS